MPGLHSITARIAAVVVLALAVAAGLGWAALGELRSALVAQKSLELRHEVETVWTMIEGWRARAAKGEISDAEARKGAREAIRPIRFGDEANYFFVYENDGTNVLLPAKPELEGKNLIDMKDKSGRFFIRELIAAGASGGGLVTYD